MSERVLQFEKRKRFLRGLRTFILGAIVGIAALFAFALLNPVP